MSKILITPEDLNNIKNEYPLLRYDNKYNKISGEITLNLWHEGKKPIRGERYSIEFQLLILWGELLPLVKDISHKILKIAIRKKMNPLDLHLVSYNYLSPLHPPEKGIIRPYRIKATIPPVPEYLCLIHPSKIKNRYPQGFNLKEFLHHIEEHLYWVTYFDRYNEPPWQDEPHGIIYNK